MGGLIIGILLIVGIILLSMGAFMPILVIGGVLIGLWLLWILLPWLLLGGIIFGIFYFFN